MFTESYLPDPNGIATTVAATAKILQEKGHTVYIVAPKHPRFKDEKNVIRLYSLKIYEKLDMRTALHLPERNLIKILRLKLDIVHGHGGGSVSLIGWEVAQIKNIPFVGTYHTIAHEYSHYILRGKVVTPQIIKTVTKIFGNMCEHLIAPTERAKSELRKVGVKSPITVLASGINRSEFTDVSKGYLHSKLHLKPGTKILLYVGRLGREKSVDFLVKSFKHIAQSNPDTVLVMVGDGPETKKLKELARELKISNKVYLTGFIKGEYIPQVYADADIFVFASKTETQGMVIIEAMASRIPVVAVKDPAFSEMIENGKNGFLTQRSEKDFSDHVEKLLSSPTLYKKMSTHAKESTLKYSLEEKTQDLEGLYVSLIESHKKREASPIRKTFRGARRLINLLSE